MWQKIPLALLFLVGVSALAAEPIEEIQGLWLEADHCRCAVRGLDRGALKAMPVRCYHYFTATTAISGYIRLGERRQKDRSIATAAQRCQTPFSLLNETIKDSFYQLADSLKRLGNSSLGVLRSAARLPPSIAAIPYARGTIAYAQGNRENSAIRVSIWDEDLRARGGKGYDDGMAINFNYGFLVGALIGRREGICSAYRKFSPDELYIGIHDNQRHSRADCESRRYRVLERYIRVY